MFTQSLSFMCSMQKEKVGKVKKVIKTGWNKKVHVVWKQCSRNIHTVGISRTFHVRCVFHVIVFQVFFSQKKPQENTSREPYGQNKIKINDKLYTQIKTF